MNKGSKRYLKRRCEPKEEVKGDQIQTVTYGDCAQDDKKPLMVSSATDQPTIFVAN